MQEKSALFRCARLHIWCASTWASGGVYLVSNGIYKLLLAHLTTLLENISRNG